MSVKWPFAFAAIGVVSFVAFELHGRNATEELPYEPTTRVAEAAPIAPWIEPEKDMRLFFPGATESKTEKYPLSAQGASLAQKLGRPLEPGENLLTLHRIYKGDQPVGSAVIQRVKGEYGAIDLVIALSETETIEGVRIQRSREPAAVEAAIENPNWLAKLRGRSASSQFGGADLEELPTEARSSARAVLGGVRSALILEAAHRNTHAARSHH